MNPLNIHMQASAYYENQGCAIIARLVSHSKRFGRARPYTNEACVDMRCIVEEINVFFTKKTQLNE